ncbi:unnamed protein product [Brassicogethes aeneus]|uniref:KANSL3 helical domain-containing protein n=1 Tax=Brassicogethes aeneus TaxID=1431903 RepID=A0A9P0BBR1_BRAAE|nr:unnamed protein product [Brassicogethes aeneus]
MDNNMLCNNTLNFSENSQLSHKIYEAQDSMQTANPADFDFATPMRNSFIKNPEDCMKYAYSNDRENWAISSDHCYARPWNWRPESSFLRPAKTLFIQKSQHKSNRKSTNPLAPLQDAEDLIDVDSEPVDQPLNYDFDKAKQLMDECDRFVETVNPEAEEDEENWEDKIDKSYWTVNQNRVYQGFVNVLNMYHLAKLAQTNARHEPIIRRTVVDKAAQRVRRVMALVSWDTTTCQWIHQLLIDNLSKDYLAAYLDILQTLKYVVPSFAEKFMQNCTPKLATLSNESLTPLLKRPWDPVESSLQLDKPKKLPGNPVLVVVPSGPTMPKRMQKWVTQLSNLGTVITIPTNIGSTGHRMTMGHCADQLFVTTRAKIQEIKADHPGRGIVLVGFNTGATLALQIAQVDTVLCVVCLGFSLLTAEGRRGEPDDNILELQIPVLFVIGQCSNTSLQEDVEDLRERMRVETGLIVVGSADDYLRVNKKKKRSEGITQSVVDRCVVDEVGEFVSGIILSPFPPQLRQSPAHGLSDGPLGSKKGTKNERKRYNSNASSLDSEPPSPTPRITRPVGRPPGSKAKSKLEAKWAAQIAQGTPQTPSPGSSPSHTVFTPDTSSNDSSFTDKPPTQPAPIAPNPPPLTTTPTVPSNVKKIKTLRPFEKAKHTVAGGAATKQQTQAAKLQAYGFNRSMMAGGPMSTLLQGGIKTLPPSQSKASGIKVLENVTLNSSATAKLISNTGRTIDLSKITVINPSNQGKCGNNMGNVILLPDGKIKAVHGSTIKGTGNTPILLPGIKGGKYITSKRQLIGNKPPRPLKKISFMHQNSMQTLPPPTNLTTQDIMDLPIIFADDNQILDTPIAEDLTTSVQMQQPKVAPPTNTNKFVLVNKQMSSSSNFIISPSVKKSPINLQKQQPKYTKIILSKRNSTEEKKGSNLITKISGLPSDITVKKLESSSSSTFTLASPDEAFDLENELVATAVPKPNLSTSDVKNITIFKQASGGINSPLHPLYCGDLKRPKERMEVDSDDPDYIPPKSMKYE